VKGAAASEGDVFGVWSVCGSGLRLESEAAAKPPLRLIPIFSSLANPAIEVVLGVTNLGTVDGISRKT
jgi:hypothetical protein